MPSRICYGYIIFAILILYVIDVYFHVVLLRT